MKNSVYVDQLVLEAWKGKIDCADALLIAFIQDLNPQNPAIRDHMWRGHFLITLKWIQDQLPILQLSESTIFRRLQKLQRLGILDSIKKQVRGSQSLSYFKLSDAFWRVHKKRHAEATKAAQKAENDVCTGANVTLASEVDDACAGASNASQKDAVKRDTPPSGPDGAAAVVSEEDRTAATALVQELLAGWDLRAHQAREERRRLLEEQRAALLGGSIADGLTA